jgi:hypothetical protein
MRNPTKGNPRRLQYRVETPFTNGNLDHLFADKAQAIEYADKGANEFGMAIMFDHLTNKITHISYHAVQFGKNAKQFDYQDEVNLKQLQLASKNYLDK